MIHTDIRHIVTAAVFQKVRRDLLNGALTTLFMGPVHLFRLLSLFTGNVELPAFCFLFICYVNNENITTHLSN